MPLSQLSDEFTTWQQNQLNISRSRRVRLSTQAFSRGGRAAEQHSEGPETAEP